MLQNFKSDQSANDSNANIKNLREILSTANLNGFYLQRADEHLSENIAASAERLEWLTGFTGSTAQAIILMDQAAFFVDGRYTLQARQQLDETLYETHFIGDTSPSSWLKEHCEEEIKIGFDPKLHSIAQIEALKKKLSTYPITLVAVESNPIDSIWKDQPAPPKGPVTVHPLKYAGVKPESKIADIQKKLKIANIQHAIITDPSSIAWLFNIRGKDVPRTPLALSFAILHTDKKPDLYIDPEKLNAASQKHLNKFATISPIPDMEAKLEQLKTQQTRILLSPHSATFWFLDKLQGGDAEIVRRNDPCLLPKAIKNPKEVEGSIAAHVRDGAAMCRFLSWLDDMAPTGKIDEIGAAQKLEQYRKETKALKDISFDTISGAGPNGAVIHYRVTENTNKKLKSGSLYLVDSGGQYLDGTTDITRTIAIGKPTKEMITRFTQVLKGMIAVTLARFPKGTNGTSIDMLARMALWQSGLDFAHGTGHGVGSYLGVHEGPQSISKRSTVSLEPNMILSNEPGYYKEGKFGIRIENLIRVTEPAPIKSGEIDMMGFDTLTLAPIDTRLINPSLLSDDELNWLNKYHARVRKTLTPHLDKNVKSWLKNATTAMSKAS